MEEENIVKNSKDMGAHMAGLMYQMKDSHPSVGDVRSIGLFGGIELVKNKSTKDPLTPLNGTHPAMTNMVKFLRNNGVFTFTNGNVLHCNPPLIINKVHSLTFVNGVILANIFCITHT